MVSELDGGVAPLLGKTGMRRSGCGFALVRGNVSTVCRCTRHKRKACPYIADFQIRTVADLDGANGARRLSRSDAIPPHAIVASARQPPAAAPANTGDENQAGRDR